MMKLNNNSKAWFDQDGRRKIASVPGSKKTRTIKKNVDVLSKNLNKCHFNQGNLFNFFQSMVIEKSILW